MATTSPLDASRSVTKIPLSGESGASSTFAHLGLDKYWIFHFSNIMISVIIDAAEIERIPKMIKTLSQTKLEMIK